MNDNRIDCQERNQPNHGLISDCNFEYTTCSSHHFGVQQQPWNMGVWVQQPTMDQGGSQIQHLGHGKPSTTIMSRFESPTSAFYATERCMGLPQYECQVVGYPALGSHTSRTCEGQFPSGQSSGDNCYSDSADQADPKFEFRNSLQPSVKPQLCSFQSNRSFEKSNHISCSNMQEGKLFGHQQHKLHEDNALSVRRNFSVPFIENQDHAVCIFLSFLQSFLLLLEKNFSIFYIIEKFGFYFMMLILLYRSIPIHSVLLLHTLVSPPLINRSSLQDFPPEMVVLLQLILLHPRQYSRTKQE